MKRWVEHCEKKNGCVMEAGEKDAQKSRCSITRESPVKPLKIWKDVATLDRNKKLPEKKSDAARIKTDWIFKRLQQLFLRRLQPKWFRDKKRAARNFGENKLILLFAQGRALFAFNFEIISWFGRTARFWNCRGCQMFLETLLAFRDGKEILFLTTCLFKHIYLGYGGFAWT